MLLVFVQLYRKESTSVEKKERVTSLFRGEGLQCPGACQGPENVLLYRSGFPMASSVFGFRVIREGDPGLFKGVLWDGEVKQV